MPDALIIFLAVAGAAYANHRTDRPDRWILQGLLGYHLVFSLIFTYYILSRHGDALAYWTLTTTLWGEPAESWMGHFGLSSFFLHWLNYWPDQWGLSFLTGNVLYGLLGYLGIRYVYLVVESGFTQRNEENFTQRTQSVAQRAPRDEGGRDEGNIAHEGTEARRDEGGFTQRDEGCFTKSTQSFRQRNEENFTQRTQSVAQRAQREEGGRVKGNIADGGTEGQRHEIVPETPKVRSVFSLRSLRLLSALCVKPFFLIFFLPNMHFWTAGVGKEAVTMFGLGWMLYGLSDLRQRGWQVLPAFAVLFMVRPHIGFLMGGLTFLYFFLKPGWPWKWKATFVAAMAVALAGLYPVLTGYLVIPDFSWQSLSRFMDFQLDFLQGQHVGSAVDMQSYNQLQRIFTYLFRPLFFDAYNPVTFLASFENLFYLLFTLLALTQIRKSSIAAVPGSIWIGLAFFLVTTLIFSNSLGNLGIMMRMKSFTMVFWLVWLWGSSRNSSRGFLGFHR